MHFYNNFTDLEFLKSDFLKDVVVSMPRRRRP